MTAQIIDDSARLSAVEILAKAADLVEHSGRWVGHLPRANKICAAVAISESAGIFEENLSTTAKVALCREVDLFADANDYERRRKAIFAFNDAPGRTKEEVATALRNAKRWL